MSGEKTRHFYNNICSMPDARYLEVGVWKGSSFCSAMCNNTMTCLAIDNWAGVNGRQYLKHIKEEFAINFRKFAGQNKAFFLEKNCWKILPTKLGICFPINNTLIDEPKSTLDLYGVRENGLAVSSGCSIDALQKHRELLEHERIERLGGMKELRYVAGKFNVYMYDGFHSIEAHFNALPHFLNCLDDEFIYLVDDWNCKEIAKVTLEAIEACHLEIVWKKEIFTDYLMTEKSEDWHNGIGIFVLKNKCATAIEQKRRDLERDEYSIGQSKGPATIL